MLRNLRIAALLLILLFVALSTWFDRVYSTDWDAPLRITLQPINADRSSMSDRYIAALKNEDFAGIERFYAREAAHYRIKLDRPIRMTLRAPIEDHPPALSARPNVLSVMLWSLRLRLWSWRHADGTQRPQPDIRLFLLYFDPERTPVLGHSVGLQKGLMGVVNVFAERHMNGSNTVVIAHELLHTLGATDKYGPGNNQPRFPDGYAEPDRQPRLPQQYAELMAGRIPLSETTAETPTSLDDVLIGPATAREIGWERP